MRKEVNALKMFWNKTWTGFFLPQATHGRLLKDYFSFWWKHVVLTLFTICLFHRGEGSGSELQLAKAFSWLLIKSRTNSVEGIYYHARNI